MGDLPVWVNGVPESRVSVSDRGLAYGDGLFETVRISNRRPTLAALHWRRLSQGCQKLGIPLNLQRLMDEVDAFLSSAPMSDGVLKVIITRGSGGRGYNPEGCQTTRRILSIHPLPQRTPDPAVHGARVMACRFRLGQSELAGMKHLNRLEQVLARQEWSGNAYDEGLLSDFSGNLIEGTMSNLFMVNHQGELVTPDLSGSGVKGVCREFVIALAGDMGLTVVEAPISLQFLQNSAAEVFLCNSVNGVWPVVLYDQSHWGVGSVTMDIRDRVREELNA